MITTARAIIKRSLRLIAATAAGEDPTDDEFTDCFDALTTLVEAWDIEKLMATNSGIYKYSAPASILSFYIGPDGDFITPKILTFLDYVYISSSGMNYEVEIPSSRKEFDDEVKNSPTGWPVKAYYTKHIPSLTESLLEFSCPLPDAATISFGSTRRDTNFVDLDTPIDLPPGLKRAFEYNLAVEVAPEFQLQPSQVVSSTAAESKALLKLHNLQIGKLSAPDEIGLLGRGGFDVRTGE